MRKAAKRSPLPPAKKKRRHKKEHALVAPKFEVLADGAHAVTIPVFTRNVMNMQLGNSKAAGMMRQRARKAERDAVDKHLFGVGVSFRGVTLVRLAPSSGLDTGGLWSALKGVQDAIAEHLGVDDSQTSPASWRMEQDRSKDGYGVRVELRLQREPSWHELRAEVEQLRSLVASHEAVLRALSHSPENTQSGQLIEVLEATP